MRQRYGDGVLALLNKHEVQYLIVGGYAKAIRGYPRYIKTQLPVLS